VLFNVAEPLFLLFKAGIAISHEDIMRIMQTNGGPLTSKYEAYENTFNIFNYKLGRFLRIGKSHKIVRKCETQNNLGNILSSV